ncbi:MAG TPA: WD40 repeat domain-containing protein [Polyangia bacterium]
MGQGWRLVGACVVIALGACHGGAPTGDGDITTNPSGGGLPGGPPSGGTGAGAGTDPNGGSSATGPGVPCGALAFSAPLTLAPAASGQAYTRCGTLGPESGWQVTLAPAGNRLAALTGAGTVRLVATDSWSEVAQLASPLGRIDAAAFSPDGTVLATLSWETGTVALWRAADGSLLQAVPGPPSSGVDTTDAALAFSSDGARLATSLATVIDLQTGASTSWLDGTKSTFALQVNPENLSFSGGVPAAGSVALMRFTGANARLFIQAHYQVGNSPTSTRLSLRDPTTGAQVALLFEMFTRALLGFAISPDGKLVAVGKAAEAAVGGFAAGLSLFDAATGAEVAFDPTFTGMVLGFSPDGARLYTRAADAITARATTDLHAAGQFAWPVDAVFLGISPSGDIVGTVGGQTSWWDPATGAVVRSASYPLAAATWSSDGRFGAGSGDPASLFHFWREADGAPLCAPAADTTSAPSLASLGTPGPFQPPQTAASVDGSLTVTASFIVHTHAADYDVLTVKDAASGDILRRFGATVDTQPIAISVPAGDRLYTAAGSDVAIWCR